MKDLGTLGGKNSSASHINDLGQIAGNSEYGAGAEQHGFFWTNGRMIDLGTLDGTASYAADLNNRGQVVGTSTTAAGETHCFLWAAGVMTDLGTLGGNDCYALDITDPGPDRRCSDAARLPATMQVPEGRWRKVPPHRPTRAPAYHLADHQCGGSVGGQTGLGGCGGQCFERGDDRLLVGQGGGGDDHGGGGGGAAGGEEVVGDLLDFAQAHQDDERVDARQGAPVGPCSLSSARWPVTTAKVRLRLRWVTGTPAAAGAAMALLTPGTTSTGTPAAAR